MTETDAPFIPCSVPDLRGNEAQYLQRCVSDNWVSSAGPFVTRFESEIASFCGASHAVAMVNGTAALHMALIVCGVRPGDEVVVPDWTFAATANAVCQAGATPVFVDVSATGWSLDAQTLERALDARQGRVKAVMVVHPLGSPADMATLAPLCARFDVPLIEDAAGALGARCEGRAVGAMGRVGTFSFNGNKIVTAGGGGMLVTQSQALADRARSLSTQSRRSDRYWHDEPAFNYRMTNVNAAIGVAQLERLDEMLAARRRVSECYAEAIRDRDDIQMAPVAVYGDSNYWLSAIRLASPADAASLSSLCRAAGIDARTFWNGLSGQPAYAGSPAYLNGVSQALSDVVLTLPSGSQMTRRETDRVLAALAQWRGAASPALPSAS